MKKYMALAFASIVLGSALVGCTPAEGDPSASGTTPKTDQLKPGDGEMKNSTTEDQ